MGLALTAAGLWRIEGSLAAIGLALCLLVALSWLAGRLNLARLGASLAAPSTVAAGAVFPAVLTLRNGRAFWDSFDLRVELELPHDSVSPGHANWLAADSCVDIQFRPAIRARAHRARHPLRVRSAFPFGFFETRRTLMVEHDLLTLPRPVPPGDLQALGVQNAALAGGSAAGDASGEPRGVRAWHPGDRARLIAWPATIRAWSRGAGPLVWDSDPPGLLPRRCLVLFHSFGGDRSLIRPDRFEHALSLAAGALQQLQGMGVAARLVADFDGWTERPARNRSQLASCQTVLARARRARGTEAHDLLAAARRAQHDEMVVVLSDMPAKTWRHTFAELPVPPLTLEIPPPRRPFPSSRP